MSINSRSSKTSKRLENILIIIRPNKIYVQYLNSQTQDKDKTMLNKIIDILGYGMITFMIGYAVYFYASELIRIIS